MQTFTFQLYCSFLLHFLIFFIFLLKLIVFIFFRQEPTINLLFKVSNFLFKERIFPFEMFNFQQQKLLFFSGGYNWVRILFWDFTFNEFVHGRVLIFIFSRRWDVKFGLNDVDLFFTIAIRGQGYFCLIRLHSWKKLLMICVRNFKVEVRDINNWLF